MHKVSLLLFITFLILLNSNCSKKVHNIQMFGIPVSNTGLSNSVCNTNCQDSSIISKSFSENESSGDDCRFSILPARAEIISIKPLTADRRMHKVMTYPDPLAIKSTIYTATFNGNDVVL